MKDKKAILRKLDAILKSKKDKLSPRTREDILIIREKIRNARSNNEIIKQIIRIGLTIAGILHLKDLS